MGRVGSSLADLEFYDPNPTRPAIQKKKKKICNPIQPVGLGWVRLVLASWLHTPTLASYSLQVFIDWQKIWVLQEKLEKK